jgi:glutathione S-transferase
MTIMKLYTYPITPNALKMELLINAEKMTLDTEIIDLSQGEHKTRDYLAMNPAGKIPMIIDGEYVLAESNAILIYLAQYYKSKLWPSTIDAQAKVMQWLFWQASEWASVAGGFSFQRVLRPAWGDQADENKLSASQAGFASACMFLSNHLEKQRFLAGEHVSLADIAVGAFFIFRKEALMDIEPFEGLNRWLEELESQKWWQETQDDAAIFLNSIHAYTFNSK